MRTIEYIGEMIDIDEYQDKHRPGNQPRHKDVPLDPVQRQHFYGTPNELREKEEIADWWDIPYIMSESGGYTIWCLDGGAWDRPTWVGKGKSLNEAVQIATDYTPFSSWAGSL